MPDKVQVYFYGYNPVVSPKVLVNGVAVGKIYYRESFEIDIYENEIEIVLQFMFFKSGSVKVKLADQGYNALVCSFYGYDFDEEVRRLTNHHPNNENNRDAEDNFYMIIKILYMLITKQKFFTWTFHHISRRQWEDEVMS